MSSKLNAGRCGASPYSMQNFTYPLNFQHGPGPKFSWVLLNPDSIWFSFYRILPARDERGTGSSLYTLFFSQFYLEFCEHLYSQTRQHKSSGFMACHCWLRFELSLGITLITNLLLLHVFSHSICPFGFLPFFNHYPFGGIFRKEG